MSVQLAQQAKTILGQSELVIITERVDDVALLIGQMITMGLPDILDRHIPRHWKQRGLRWGWTAVIWLAHIRTEGDHRKVAVEVSIQGMHHTLSRLTAQVIPPLDVSDDRLSHLLTHVSQPKYWQKIEQALNARRIEVHALPAEVIRCDATTVSGAHEVSAEGLLQCGQSKDDPTRPQIKVMLGSLDPLGMPLATDVLSGERADDGLSLTLMQRIRPGVTTTGRLFVGDGKRSALETRASIVGHHDWYVSPLPCTGAPAEAMHVWISEGVARGETGAFVPICRPNDRGHEVLTAEGYAFERTCRAKGSHEGWTERVMVVRSPLHAHQQAAGLDKRLCHAETALTALTPPRGRGKRQITDEATLVEAIDRVLKAHRVEGLLSVVWAKQVEQRRQYLGRGRGSARRQQRVIKHTRYHITCVARQEDTIASLRQQYGWKAFVTNARPQRLSLEEAVLCYRHEYRVERVCNRLKSRLRIAPLFVKRNDQIEGLTSLLTLGVRVLTVTEFVLQRSLAQEQATLPGLHPENKRKRTSTPSAERLLQAFVGVSLTIIQCVTGEELLRRLTPLSAGQEAILQRLGLGTNLYRQLEIQNMES